MRRGTCSCVCCRPRPLGRQDGTRGRVWGSAADDRLKSCLQRWQWRQTAGSACRTALLGPPIPTPCAATGRNGYASSGTATCARFPCARVRELHLLRLQSGHLPESCHFNTSVCHQAHEPCAQPAGAPRSLLQVAIRDAPCAGHPWRYSKHQLVYHYTGDREILRRLVAVAGSPKDAPEVRQSDRLLLVACASLGPAICLEQLCSALGEVACQDNTIPYSVRTLCCQECQHPVAQLARVVPVWSPAFTQCLELKLELTAKAVQCTASSGQIDSWKLESARLLNDLLRMHSAWRWSWSCHRRRRVGARASAAAAPAASSRYYLGRAASRRRPGPPTPRLRTPAAAATAAATG